MRAFERENPLRPCAGRIATCNSQCSIFQGTGKMAQIQLVGDLRSRKIATASEQKLPNAR